jgi:hypothetical protein
MGFDNIYLAFLIKVSYKYGLRGVRVARSGAEKRQLYHREITVHTKKMMLPQRS